MEKKVKIEYITFRSPHGLLNNQDTSSVYCLSGEIAELFIFCANCSKLIEPEEITEAFLCNNKGENETKGTESDFYNHCLKSRYFCNCLRQTICVWEQLA